MQNIVIHLSPSYNAGIETQQGNEYHPKNGEKKQVLFYNWHGFWVKPKPSHNISKKKDHCLRNTYKTKICNIVILQHFITTKGVRGALGIQQPYPLPPNDKMKKSNKHHTYQKKIIILT